MLAGCGSKPPEAEKTAQKDNDRGTTAIQTGEATVSLPGAWTMEVDDSQIKFVGEADSAAVVKGVRGELLEAGKVASRFVATDGHADTATGRLVLTGRVRVTSERDGVFLTADKITYDEKNALVIAEGSVMVESDTWTSGPRRTLVAPPGLERIGTPDRFGL